MYGNENISNVLGSQFIAYAGTSENTELPARTYAVSLYATSDCWVTVGEKGKTPVAAAPSAEKVIAPSFFLPLGTWIDVGIPMSSDASLVSIAVIQATAGGNLYITNRGQL